MIKFNFLSVIARGKIFLFTARWHCKTPNVQFSKAFKCIYDASSNVLDHTTAMPLILILFWQKGPITSSDIVFKMTPEFDNCVHKKLTINLNLIWWWPFSRSEYPLQCNWDDVFLSEANQIVLSSENSDISYYRCSFSIQFLFPDNEASFWPRLVGQRDFIWAWHQDIILLMWPFRNLLAMKSGAAPWIWIGLTRKLMIMFYILQVDLISLL